MGAKKITPVSDIQFLTLTEVSLKIKAHRKTVERYVREGKLQTVKIAGKRLVTEKSFREFLNSNLLDGDLGL
jgi:predicted site-specific integrase-resolvase